MERPNIQQTGVRLHMRSLRIYTLCLLLFTISLWSWGGPVYGASYIDDNNRLIVDGNAFFPIGLYVVQWLTDTGQINEISGSGFNTLVNYNINNGTNSQITTYLNNLQSRNLKLIYSLAEYIPYNGETAKCGAINAASMAQKVSSFKGHPAVISWYLNDERGSFVQADQAFCIQQLEAGYQTIAVNDPGLDGRPDHPVWSVHWYTGWLRPQAHTTDVLGMDTYPIAHFANPMDEVKRVAGAAAQVGAEKDKPFWMVLQIFSWRDYPWDSRYKTGRPPTRKEMRAMTYLATNRGAKGLIYYSYFDIRNDADYAERWPQIKGIAAEISELSPVFLSTDRTNAYDITCNNGSIDFKLMKQGGDYYLFAVNTKNENIAGVSFQNNMEVKPHEINVLFEARTQIPTDNGNFIDDFGPYEVHVYRWDEGGECLRDETAPVPDVADLPTLEGECSVEITSVPAATDNCAGAVQGTTSDPLVYTEQGTYHVTWTYTDVSGNISTQEQTVVLADTTPPDISLSFVESHPYYTTQTLHLNYDANDICDVAPVVYVELNGQPVNISGGSPVSIDLAQIVGSNSVTATATDASGNVATASITFEVILDLTGDQLVIKPETLKANHGVFTAFVRLPEPYDALTITSAVADGAHAVEINYDELEHRAAIKFRRADITALPVDEHFEVTGEFLHNGATLTFAGSDDIMKVKN